MRDHPLTEELKFYIDRARVYFLLDGILAQLEQRPIKDFMSDSIRVSANDEISLPDGELDARYSLLRFSTVMNELIATHHKEPAAEQLVVDCVNGTVTISQARERLAALGWKGPVPPWQTVYTPTDPKERDLIAAVNGGDEVSRQVYGDWLEQQGFEKRASFLRTETSDADPADMLWRMAISRARIIGCDASTCPKQWDALERSPKPTVRRCKTCRSDIQYCVKLSEVTQAAWMPTRVCADASIESQAQVEYNAVRFRPPVGNPPAPVLRTYNPPPPMPPPPLPPTTPSELEPRNPPPPGYGESEDKTGVLARFFGWFKKKT